MGLIAKVQQSEWRSEVRTCESTLALNLSVCGQVLAWAGGRCTGHRLSSTIQRTTCCCPTRGPSACAAGTRAQLSAETCCPWATTTSCAASCTRPPTPASWPAATTSGPGSGTGGQPQTRAPALNRVPFYRTLPSLPCVPSPASVASHGTIFGSQAATSTSFLDSVQKGLFLPWCGIMVEKVGNADPCSALTDYCSVIFTRFVNTGLAVSLNVVFWRRVEY